MWSGHKPASGHGQSVASLPGDAARAVAAAVDRVADLREGLGEDYDFWDDANTRWSTRTIRPLLARLAAVC